MNDHAWHFSITQCWHRAAEAGDGWMDGENEERRGGSGRGNLSWTPSGGGENSHVVQVEV